MNLNTTEHSFVLLAIYTARGQLDALQSALNDAFDQQNITVNQAKSLMEQLYAYCGFPRSLNALTTLLTVVNERTKQSKPVMQGEAISTIPKQDLTVLGETVQTKLVGQKVAGALFEFSPEIDHYLKSHLFGDIFADQRLNYQQRELITIAALGSMQGVSSQFNSHIKIGQYNGISEEKINEIKAIITTISN